MSGRRTEILANHEIYHVFNRSVANDEIFTKKRDLERALELFKYYRYSQRLRYSVYSKLAQPAKKNYQLNFHSTAPLVTIYAFSLMPNHYHFLLRQESEDGIRKFTSNFQNSFGKYFNAINKRAGSVFQKPFKAKRIGTDEEFLHVGRYIHLNPVTSYLIDIEELGAYPWTSYGVFFSNRDQTSNFIDLEFTVKLIGSTERYKKFVRDQVDYQRKLAEIKHLLIELN